jgi:hypothetical protein
LPIPTKRVRASDLRFTRSIAVSSAAPLLDRK